ncbi:MULTISPECIES: hypothetical protein [unclassified Nocardia]|uniref:hypothetical protein n=1 Tax=unclassified Nocardia TaxID=2637762 RepID=UPI001CE4B55C|nr:MULTISPECIES: hypothetical protein [unclassified Nocardia]
MRSPSIPVTGQDELFDYVSRLRTDPQSANPADWQVDWADGPWPVKVYSGARRIRLDPASGLARVLAGSLAVNRIRVDATGGLPSAPGRAALEYHGSQYLMRRSIPSGGAMYPTELYVLWPGANQVGHYDAYRNELVHLGRANGIREAIGEPEDLPPLMLLLCNRFWKNFYKYGNFAARLGSVDTGVVLGRLVRSASACFGRVEVRADFSADLVGAMLGLDPAEELCVSLLGLGHPGSVRDSHSPSESDCVPTVIERSRVIKRSALFDAWNAAAKPTVSGGPYVPGPMMSAISGREIALPEPKPIDLLDPNVLRHRRSNGRLFTGATVTAMDLATVLVSAADAVSQLRACADGVLGTDIHLFCAVHRVAQVPAGWYRYEDGRLIAVGDGGATAADLQRALFADTVNIELAAFTVHPVAPTDFRAAGRGMRGYREQQFGIGAAVEALTVAAAAVGSGSHPVLGFDADLVDRAYGLSGTAFGTHAQVSVGAVGVDPNWEIAVMLE